MPAITRPLLPAGRRHQAHRELRGEARRHRRRATSTRTSARSRGRRAGSRSSSRRCSPRRTGAVGAPASVSEVWPNLRVLFGGGVSADAVPARHPRPRRQGRRDPRRHLQRDRGRRLRDQRLQRGPGDAHAPAPGHLLRVHPAGGPRQPLAGARARSGPSSADRPYAIVRDDRVRPLRVQAGRHRAVPADAPAADGVRGAPLRLPLGHAGADHPRRDRAGRRSTP